MTTTNIKFLQEWNNDQFTAMDKAIVKHFRNRIMSTNYGMHTMTHSFKAIDNLLGLAYTSSSSFAMYSICNVSLHYDEVWEYECFGISEDSKFYAYLKDRAGEGKEKIIEL